MALHSFDPNSHEGATNRELRDRQPGFCLDVRLRRRGYRIQRRLQGRHAVCSGARRMRHCHRRGPCVSDICSRLGSRPVSLAGCGLEMELRRATRPKSPVAKRKMPLRGTRFRGQRRTDAAQPRLERLQCMRWALDCTADIKGPKPALVTNYKHPLSLHAQSLRFRQPRLASGVLLDGSRCAHHLSSGSVRLPRWPGCLSTPDADARRQAASRLLSLAAWAQWCPGCLDTPSHRCRAPGAPSNAVPDP